MPEPIIQPERNEAGSSMFINLLCWKASHLQLENILRIRLIFFNSFLSIQSSATNEPAVLPSVGTSQAT